MGCASKSLFTKGSTIHFPPPRRAMLLSSKINSTLLFPPSHFTATVSLSRPAAFKTLAHHTRSPAGQRRLRRRRQQQCRRRRRLDYSLWRAVQGVASQVSGVLATQALLYAVGLGKGAIPTAVAVNWVLKDGIGYLSKIMLSKYGRHFDVNPKGRS